MKYERPKAFNVHQQRIRIFEDLCRAGFDSSDGQDEDLAVVFGMSVLEVIEAVERIKPKIFVLFYYLEEYPEGVYSSILIDMFKQGYSTQCVDIQFLNEGITADDAIIIVIGYQPSIPLDLTIQPHGIEFDDLGVWLGKSLRDVCNLPTRKWCVPQITDVLLSEDMTTCRNRTPKSHPKYTRRDKLISLSCRAKSCHECPAMSGRKRVLSQVNGSPYSEIMFIGEAPGKDGAGLTGLPFYRDPSGKNFERLLASIGLDYDNVFVTNAVLCNPLEDGKNRTPTAVEQSNCSIHLKKTIQLVRPKVIATLGAQALDALNRIEAHSFQLSRDVGKIYSWYDTKLVPLYHTSPRALSRRSMDRQRNDFKVLKQFVKKKNPSSARSKKGVLK